MIPDSKVLAMGLPNTWLSCPVIRCSQRRQMQTLNPLKMSLVPCQQHRVSREADSSDEVVRHADAFASRLELAPNAGGHLAGVGLQWKDR